MKKISLVFDSNLKNRGSDSGREAVEAHRHPKQYYIIKPADPLRKLALFSNLTGIDMFALEVPAAERRKSLRPQNFIQVPKAFQATY